MRARVEASSPEPDSPESRRIPRRFRRLYILALGTVAALAIGGQIGVQVALNAQRDSGHVVNQAGLQRMLSQRLALKLLLLEDAAPAERPARRAEIRDLSERWQRSHARLMDAVRELAPNAATRESLLALFDEVERPLRALAGVADAVAGGAPLDRTQRETVLRSQEIFLPLMDVTVREIEQSATARVARLQGIELGLLVLTLVVLAIEALLVFRPAVQRLGVTLAELEDKRRDSVRRLESLRHLSGGIAHHFNNILTSILGNAELIRLEGRRDGRVQEYAEAQVQQSQRAADMISQLVLYAGEREVDPRPIELGGWLHEVVKALPRPATGVAVEVTVREKAVAMVDPTLLRDAVDGLIANAIEATPDASRTVRVELSQEVFDELRTMAGPYRLQLTPGLYARVQVIDHGVGIPREEIDRIFDPFYSHKSFGRGLGLASILGVAHAHEGGVEVASKPGRGTTFSLYLPLSVEVPAKRVAAGRLKRV